VNNCRSVAEHASKIILGDIKKLGVEQAIRNGVNQVLQKKIAMSYGFGAWTGPAYLSEQELARMRADADVHAHTAQARK
jgi:hypothetical protein